MNTVQQNNLLNLKFKSITSKTFGTVLLVLFQYVVLILQSFDLLFVFSNLDNHLRNVHGLKQNEFLGIVVTDMAQFIQSLEKTGRDVEDIGNITLEGEPDDQNGMAV